MARLDLKDTVELMNSSDYRDRFVAEYIQLKIRWEKLKRFNTVIEAAVRTAGQDNGVDEPIHDCPASLLREQQAAMGELLHILEVRAVIEDIDLEDVIASMQNAKCKMQNEVRAGDAEKVKLDAPCEVVKKATNAEKLCDNCVHLPICEYCSVNLKGFSLPEGNSCDMFLRVKET